MCGTCKYYSCVCSILTKSLSSIAGEERRSTGSNWSTCLLLGLCYDPLLGVGWSLIPPFRWGSRSPVEHCNSPMEWEWRALHPSLRRLCLGQPTWLDSSFTFSYKSQTFWASPFQGRLKQVESPSLSPVETRCLQGAREEALPDPPSKLPPPAFSGEFWQLSFIYTSHLSPLSIPLTPQDRSPKGSPCLPF